MPNTSFPLPCPTSGPARSAKPQRVCSGLAVFLVAIMASISAAQQPAVIATGGGPAFIPNGGTRGWSFSLSAPVTVTHLGLLDLDYAPFPGVPPSFVGLYDAHDVAVWNADTHQLLATVNLPAGTGSQLINSFRYEPISPLQLSPGQLYVVGAHYDPWDSPTQPGGDFAIESNIANVSAAAGVTIHTGRWSTGAAISFPGGASNSPYPYFGPNFLFHLPTLPGDFNRDGTVDSADYVLWRKTDGTPEGYDQWRAHFGKMSGVASAALRSLASPPAPEPTPLVLLLVAATTAIAAARSRQSARHTTRLFRCPLD